MASDFLNFLRFFRGKIPFFKRFLPQKKEKSRPFSFLNDNY